MSRAEAEITRQLDGLIEQLQAGKSMQAGSHARQLHKELVSWTTIQRDPTKRTRLRFRFPAHDAGLDERKTRALRSSVEAVLVEMIGKDDLSGALDICQKARELWTASL